MNSIPFAFFICSWVLSLVPGSQPSEINRLHLQIENIRSGNGAIHLALYDREESFAKSLEPFLLKIYSIPADRKLQLQLDSLPAGRYSLAVYHDENGNGELDKNLFGIPKEPYGFSNNPRAKWSAPTYEETAFVLNGSPANLSVSLKRWKER